MCDDRVACDDLLNALGNFVFGSPDGFVVQVEVIDGETTRIPIRYCPFCGTRLEQTELVIIERFTQPRRRRRVIRSPAA